MNKTTLKSNFFILLLFGTIIISFFFRFKGITNNHPFWVDEYSSARQARLIQMYGTAVFKSLNKAPLYFENRNITTHFLIAWFFKLFGESEWTARLPIVIIGAIVPAAVMILARRLYGFRVAVLSGLLTTLSYYEITWSRQARGYMIQQLLALLAVFFYLRLRENKNILNLALLTFLIVLGVATHPLFFVLVIAFFIHYIITHRQKEVVAIIKNPLIILSLIFLIGLAYGIGSFSVILKSIGNVNNLWYYHAFFVREYGVLTFLALVGGLMAVFSEFRHKVTSLLVVLYVALHLFFLSFFFGPYISRYINPVFPFILLLASYSIVKISDLFLVSIRQKKYIFYIITPLILVFIIIFDRNKFVTNPKWEYYSVNHDFREIALIDYQRVYEIVKTKGSFKNHQTAIIETWLDRPRWFMGENFSDLYQLTWKDVGLVNGIPVGYESYFYNNEGVKLSKAYPKIGIISETSDLKKAIKKYPRGFIFIDDASLPKDVQEYVDKNLKKELYLDHYPLDDNPYSIWPATLYSWGI